jgi:hypothetical protein
LTASLVSSGLNITIEKHRLPNNESLSVKDSTHLCFPICYFFFSQVVRAFCNTTFPTPKRQQRASKIPSYWLRRLPSSKDEKDETLGVIGNLYTLNSGLDSGDSILSPHGRVCSSGSVSFPFKPLTDALRVFFDD